MTPPIVNDNGFAAVLQKKQRAKDSLKRYWADPNAMLLGLVGRAVFQKVGLLFEELDGRWVIEHILDLPGINVLVVGTGDPKYESLLTALNMRRYAGARSYAELGATVRRPNYAAVIAHDPMMADRVQLAADATLVTSSDEPCGIVQFESMARATPPLVRAVGGLKDTVLPHTEAGGTGFVFGGATREEVLRGLVAAVLEASRVYRNEPELFRQVQRNAFQVRFLWPTAARRYIDEMYTES